MPVFSDAGDSGTQCRSATCSAEPEEHATMLVAVATLVAGLAVAAVAFEARWPPWPLVPPRSGYSRIPFESLGALREIAAFRRASALRIQHLI